jgi:hypothetical protein
VEVSGSGPPLVEEPVSRSGPPLLEPLESGSGGSEVEESTVPELEPDASESLVRGVGSSGQPDRRRTEPTPSEEAKERTTIMGGR